MCSKAKGGMVIPHFLRQSNQLGGGGDYIPNTVLKMWKYVFIVSFITKTREK